MKLIILTPVSNTDGPCIGHAQAKISTALQDSGLHLPQISVHVALLPSSIPLPLQPLAQTNLPEDYIRVFEIMPSTYLWLAKPDDLDGHVFHLLAIGGAAARNIDKLLGWESVAHPFAEGALLICTQLSEPDMMSLKHAIFGPPDELFVNAAASIAQHGISETAIPRKWLPMDVATAHMHPHQQA